MASDAVSEMARWYLRCTDSGVGNMAQALRDEMRMRGGMEVIRWIPSYRIE